MDTNRKKDTSALESNAAIMDNVVVMYGCTPVPWQDEPYRMNPDWRPQETFTTTNTGIMKIEDYKKKFLELFRQMEEEHGRCDSVVIQHGEEYHMENGTEVSDTECTISF